MFTLGLIAITVFAQGAATQQTASSLAAKTLLVKQGFRIERLAAARAPLYAFIATGQADTAPSIVIVRAGQHPAVLGKPLPLGSFLPSTVQWVQLPESVLLLQVAFDNPVEAMIGTTLYRLEADSLHIIFDDGADACAPASLKDLNGDGIPELVVYSEDPTHGDCDQDCLLTMRESFKVIAGWAQVRRWRSGAFVADESEFAQFYRNLTARYRAVDRWLKSDAADAAQCREVYWLDENPDLFAGFAQRAQALAKQQGESR